MMQEFDSVMDKIFDRNAAQEDDAAQNQGRGESLPDSPVQGAQPLEDTPELTQESVPQSEASSIPQEYLSKLREELISNISETLKPALAFTIDAEASRLRQQLASQLPDTDVTQLLQNWKTQHEEALPFYARNPEKFISSVVQFHKAGEYDRLLADRESAIAAAAQEKAAAALEALRTSPVHDAYTYADPAGSPVSPTIRKILERHLSSATAI